MIFYRLGIFFYYLLILLASPFNEKASKWIKGRKNILQLIRESQKNETGDIIWFHVSSLGEFEQGRPLIEEIKSKYPQKKIFLTFFSPSGYEVCKKYLHANYIFYLPLDTKRNAKIFIETIKPKQVFFIKYEFWYYYLSELKKRNIPTYLIASNFRSNQIFFKPWGRFYRRFLHAFTHIFVQNEYSKVLLKKFSFTNVSIAGDTRFDRVNQIVKENKKIPHIDDFKQRKRILICGSTWPADEKNIIKWINQNQFDVKFIIAPHETNQNHIESIKKLLKVPHILYSQANIHDLKTYKVLIIDSIGILSALYKYGDLAYIGGGFGKGIHNILEPAAFGLPVIFGPNYHKFQEAKSLLSENGASTYKTYSEFAAILNKHFISNEYLNIRKNNTLKFVNKNLGSTNFILSKLKL